MLLSSLLDTLRHCSAGAFHSSTENCRRLSYYFKRDGEKEGERDREIKRGRERVRRGREMEKDRQREREEERETQTHHQGAVPLYYY